MEQKINGQRKWIWGLFIIYLLAISWIILLKFEFGLPQSAGRRSLNLIPYGASAIINGRIDFSEIFMNILAFVPFGIFCGMLKPKTSFFKKCLPFFVISLSYEVLQYIFGIGSTDITDLINNTLGGVIGLILYLLLVKLLKDRYKANQIVLILASIGTVGMMILLTLLVIVNW